jgi:hypothetical protein
MNKLNMHSRTELVKFAIRTALVKLNRVCWKTHILIFY